jgi:ABC-type phosphate transport system substrate-binding protein
MKSFLRTRSIRIVAALAVAAGTAGVASLTALSGPSAQADPLFTTAEVGVGADVTQDVYQAYSGASAPDTTTTQWFTPLHSLAADNNVTIVSFDAFPSDGSTVNPGCITTKTGGPSFDRPNSTTAGLAALNDLVTGTGFENTSASCTGTPVSLSGQINFARAARSEKVAGTNLTFIPFARDAVAYMYLSPNNSDTALGTLTTAQLKGLYSGTITTIGGDTIDPCLTITGSSPRSNLESAIGVSDSVAEPIAKGAGCDQIQQNSGNAFYTFASALTGNTAAIIPISAGDWIGQANGFSVDESNLARAGGVALGAVNDNGTNLGLPYTVSGSTLVPSTTYYQDSSYGYNIFTVVPTRNLSGFGLDVNLVDMFDNTATLPANNAEICQTAYQTTAHDFGFDSLTSSEGSCGSTSVEGNG